MGAPLNNENNLKYKPEYVGLVDKYLKKRRDRNKKVLKQRNELKGYSMYEVKAQVKLPSIEGFAAYLGVTRKTVYNWEETYPEFHKALEKIRVEQYLRLIDNGLSGDYNSTIAKLILSSNYGLRERVDATTDDKSLNEDFNDEQIDRIAKRVVERRSEKSGNTSS